MNIAIIGGSITEGAGATEYKKAYVYKLEEYLRERYKDVNIKNLGAGGTSSQFALFRLRRDLGSFKPDVIIIEFAVNDRIYDSNYSSLYFEGLIRECAKITGKIIIIDFPTGISDSCVSIHKKISYFYNLPLIDVQDDIWKKIGKREFTWSQISVDVLHPNNKGHELYFEIIKSQLENIDFEKITINLDSRILSKYRFENPTLVEYDDQNIEYYGHWASKSFNLNNKFKDGGITTSIGDGIIFNFKGKYLSMMNLLTKDSGILECRLDNYTFTIDLYMNSEEYFNTTINLDNLEDIDHTLIMIVSDQKNSNSSGNKIIVGGFLVDSTIE